MNQWPHAPLHKLDSAGTYMVTAGTYRKLPHFRTAALLTALQDLLFELAVAFGLRLQAWAIFPNHYHWIANLPQPDRLSGFVRRLHSTSARELNAFDCAPGRQIWFQYWDSRITRPKSFLARLHYVHSNAVHHGIVREATLYPWCSAAWFQRAANPAFCKTVMAFPIERVAVPDTFDVTAIAIPNNPKS